MTSISFTGPNAERSLLDWNNEDAVHPRLPAPPVVETSTRRRYRGVNVTICALCAEDLAAYDIERRYRRCRPCRGVVTGVGSGQPREAA